MASTSGWVYRGLRSAVMVLLVLGLAACRLQLDVPEGGSLVTDSGNYDCEEATRCVFQVNEPGFDEVFTAVAKPGFRFVGWRQGDAYMCWNETAEVCVLSDAGFEDNATYLDILASDETFFIEPIFQKEGSIPQLLSTRTVELNLGNLANAGVNLEGASISTIFGASELSDNFTGSARVPESDDFLVVMLDLPGEVSVPIVRDVDNSGPVKWDDMTLGFVYAQPNVYGLDHNTRAAVLRAVSVDPDYVDLREQVRFALRENPNLLLDDAAIAAQQAEIEQLAIEFIGQLNPISGSAFGDPEFAAEDIAYYYSALRSGALDRNEYREIYAWYTATTLATLALRDNLGVAPAGFAGDPTLPNLDQTSSQVARGQGEYITRNPRYAFYSYYLDDALLDILSARQGAFLDVPGGGPWQSPVNAYSPLDPGDYVAEFDTGILDTELGGPNEDSYVANLVNVTCQLVDSFSRCSLSPDEILDAGSDFTGLDLLVDELGDFGVILAGGTGTNTRQEVFLRRVRQVPELLGTVVNFGVQVDDADLRSTIRKFERFLVTGRTMAGTAYLNDLWTPVVYELGEMNHMVDICAIMLEDGVLTDPEQLLEDTGEKFLCKTDLAPEAVLRVTRAEPADAISITSPGVYALSKAAAVEFFAGDSSDDRTPDSELLFKYQLVNTQTGTVIGETLFGPRNSITYEFTEEGRFTVRLFVSDNAGNVSTTSNEINAAFSSVTIVEPTQNTLALEEPVTFVIGLSAADVFTTVNMLGNGVQIGSQAVPAGQTQVQFTFNPSDFFLRDGQSVTFTAQGVRQNSSTAEAMKTITFVSVPGPTPPPGGPGSFTLDLVNRYWEPPPPGASAVEQTEQGEVNGDSSAVIASTECTASGANRLVVNFTPSSTVFLKELKLVTAQNFTGAGTYSVLHPTEADAIPGGAVASSFVTNRCDGTANPLPTSIEGFMTVYNYSIEDSGSGKLVKMFVSFDINCESEQFNVQPGTPVTNRSNVAGSTGEISYTVTPGMCPAP